MRLPVTRLRFVAALAVIVLGALGGAPARAAAPSVPAKLPYQGVLLDASGTPRTGTVDLALRIYDAPAGGSLVYKQTFTGVPLSDGVFTVNLGPTGAATDVPTSPLTTSLAGVFSTDVGAAGIDRFLQITVGSEGALARTQILTTPFALRASSADALSGGALIGSTPSQFLEQLWQYGTADGQEPPNSDPREGILDADGDGIVNAIESDNDADGLSDASEIASGRDINLVTPQITGVAPTSGSVLGPTPVTVSGAGFQPGLSVAVGSQTPAPTSLTGTSFQILVGPQTAGSKTVSVTNANGQPNVGSASFELTTTPFAHGVSGDLGVQLHLDARDAAQLALSGTGAYATTPPGLAVAPSVTGAFASEGSDGQSVVGFDGSNRLVGLRCRTTAPDTCSLELSTDLDGDQQLEPGEVTTTIEASLTGSGASAPRLYAPDLALDASGRIVLGYALRDGAGTRVHVAYDRNGDGDFADASEKALVSSPAGAYSGAGSVAVDAAGRVALGWVESNGTNALTKLARDRNGDGDFGDASEIALLKTSALTPPPAIGVGYDPSNRITVLHNDPNFLLIKRDLNDDGDFFDAGEDDIGFFVGSNASVDVTGSAGTGRFAAAYVGGAFFRLLLDRNDDGDFADTNEQITLSAAPLTGTAPRVAVARTASGTAFVAIAGTSGGQVFYEQAP